MHLHGVPQPDVRVGDGVIPDPVSQSLVSHGLVSKDPGGKLLAAVVFGDLPGKGRASVGGTGTGTLVLRLVGYNINEE